MYTMLEYLVAAPVAYLALRTITSIAVFPGQLFAKKEHVKNFQPPEGLDLLFSEEITKSNRLLKTVKITPDNPSGHVILVLNGNNATFHGKNKLTAYCQLAIKTGHTVIGFDYSGTGSKTIGTWSFQSLVDDGLHMALKILKAMDNKHALIIKANSLGGAVATKVVRLCHENGLKPYLWDGRSFHSTSAVLAGYIRTLHISGHYEHAITKKLSTFLQPVFSLLFRLTTFETNVAEDYQKIPSEYKNYYIVRSMKSDRHKKDDITIPHCATLEYIRPIKKEAEAIIAAGKINDPKDIAFYRYRRKVTANESEENAHPMPETTLVCRQDKTLTADNLFLFFSKEYVPEHQSMDKTNQVFLSK